jgi:Ni,Fe-hydrogenase III large subunit
LILKILDKLPNGPISLKENALRIMRKIPEGETISMVEAPRGELFYFAKTNGKEGLHRLKIRTPTLANLIALKSMLVGNEIADVPVIVASIDPCFSCTDRMVIVDKKIKETRTIEREKLRYGRRKN